MSEENENKNIEAYSSSNEGYETANVLQIRLNTEPVLAKVEMFLKGQKEKYVIDNNGQPSIIAEQIAKPKANNEGVHSIMIWLGGIINSQMVQGNIENFVDKDNKVADFREDFSEYVMKNLINWNISEEEYEGIIDIAVTQMDLFLSRLVGNKERDSYSATIRHTENSSSQIRGKNGFKIPGF